MPQTLLSSYRSGDQISEPTKSTKANFVTQSSEPIADSQNFCDHRSSDSQKFYVRRTFGNETIEPKVAIKPKKVSRRKEKSIYTWIRNRTSNLDCGLLIATDEGRHPIHLNKNHEVISHFDKIRCGHRSYLNRITNRDFADHQKHKDTFYFAGQSSPKSPETLVMLDIDCDKKGSGVGTLEGAIQFAEFLEQHHFPNLYFEMSTNGKGVHGYFVLKKLDSGSTHINRLLLNRLQPWLRLIMQEQSFDVENIEVKGTLPVLTWGQKQLEVSEYRSGTLAKLPRIETPEKEEELRNTSVWTETDLCKLPVVDSPALPKVKQPVAIKPEPVKPEPVESVPIKSVVLAGSISGHHIHEDELARLTGHYQSVAEALLNLHELKTKGRTVVTVEDVSIFLMLLRFFTENMNPDGSLPVKRWQELWSSLSKSGDVCRAFCPQRFAVIRDHLSSLGLIDWEDCNFVIGTKHQKGRSAKWKAGSELMVVLQSDKKEEERRTSFIRTVDSKKKEEEGRVSFIRTRPVPSSFYRFNPDEIEAFVPPLIIAA
jgi:hypothetical protein